MISSKSYIYLHIIFVIKYRKKILTNKMLIDLENIFSTIIKNFNCELREFNGEEDHIHFLIILHQTTRLSDLIRTLKTNSSSFMFLKYPEIKQNLWKNHFWSPAYFAGSVGNVSLDTIKRYINGQSRPSTEYPECD